jgi:AcrR family transcriptional regulator
MFQPCKRSDSLPRLCDTLMHKSEQGRAPAALDARVVRTIQALHAAMLGLLERKPLDQITVRDIAAEAGISYATFFRHHSSKEALLDQIAAGEIERLVELAAPVLDAVDSEAAFVALCTYIEEHRALWTALLTGGAAATMRGALMQAAQRLAPERAPVDSWLPVELGILCSVGLVIEIITWWLRQPPAAVDVGQIALILDRLVLRPTLDLGASAHGRG